MISFSEHLVSRGLEGKMLYKTISGCESYDL